MASMMQRTCPTATLSPASTNGGEPGDEDGGVALFYGPFDGDRAAADADAIIRLGDSLDLYEASWSAT